MAQFLVYRHGSNAANQSMTRTAPVAIVYEAEDSEEAVRRVEEELPEITVYNNQRLEAVDTTSSRITDEEWDAAQENAYLPKI